MTEEEVVDLAFFVRDFDTKSITNLRLKELYGVSVSDRTDLIDAVRMYVKNLKDGKEV